MTRHARRFSQAPLYPLVLSVVFATLAFVLQRPENIDPGHDHECDIHSPWWRKTHGWWHIGQAAALFFLWYWLFYEDQSGDPYALAFLPSKDGDWHGGSWAIDLKDCPYPSVVPNPFFLPFIPLVVSPNRLQTENGS